MFIELGLDASLHIDMDILDNWICAIYRGYLPVPFHNYYHCFCVAQMAYAFIWMLQLKNNLEDLDILALMVAAIAHDMNHPGLNNTFQAISASLLYAEEVAYNQNCLKPISVCFCENRGGSAILERGGYYVPVVKLL